MTGLVYSRGIALIQMRQGLKKDRTLRTLFSGAIIFIVLGLGNIIFGNSKLDHYTALLSAATSELATSEVQSGSGATLRALNVDRQTLFVKRLKTRVGFYSLVVLGGQCFIAIAGICLLGVLVRVRYSESEQQESEQSSTKSINPE